MSLLPDDERRSLLDSISDDEAEALLHDWRFWARPNQLAPAGDWRTWLVLAGRGFGKTRVGVEWVREEVEAGRRGRLALIAPTAADARDVLVEGESGVMATARPSFRPTYEPSKRRLTWPNGAQSAVYSADEPDRLRGPQHDGMLGDEVAAWRYPETLDMAMLGLRLGSDPRAVLTTTPRPTKIIKDLVSAPTTHVTRGSTYDNLANLAPAFAEQIIRKYEGTRLGRQELLAEILTDVPGALWTYAMLEDRRPAPDMTRVIVAIDPAATSGEDSDETGIIAAGLGVDGRGYVLADRSCRLSPDGWARRAVALFDDCKGDLVVAEVNNGGEMVEGTIRTVRRTLPYKKIHASRGKQVRAQPVAALYEQGRISHVEVFPELEEQLCVAQGTLVLQRGEWAPIEWIKAGELVLTRAGLRKVLWAGQTGTNYVIRIETDNGLVLCATASHPIHTPDRGFVRADQIEECGKITICHNQFVGHLLNTGANGISLTRGPVTTAPVDLGAGVYSTLTSGSIYTAPFQPDARFTTGIMSKRTTIPATWLPSPDQNTSPSMLRADSETGRMSSGARVGVESGRKLSHESEPASNAVPRSALPAHERRFVAGPANVVTVRSVQVLPDPAPVWNLTVEDQPEFFANGILTHNCTWTPESGTSPDRLDALVWALTELMVGPERQAPGVL